jgi:hypothetical protein
MSRFAIQQIRFNNTLYPGISGWNVSPGLDINSDQLDGTVHETAHHLMETAPTAEMTTRNLGFLSALDGSTDVWLKALDGTNGLELIGGRANSALPGYVSSSTHLSRKGLRGVLMGTGIRWSKKQKAELMLKAMFISADGTTAALASAANIALPALPTPDFGYKLTSLTLNGSNIVTVESLDITCDMRAQFEYQTDLPEPIDVSMAGVNGAAMWRLAANIGDADLGSGSGTVAAVFTKLANGGGLAANTLTVTFNTNYSTEDAVSGQAGSAIGRQLIVRPRYNGTTKPVTWALAS